MSSKANSKTWIWSVSPINWDFVKTKKVWAVDSIKKSKKVSQGDNIIFYVAKSGSFQGMFKATSEWHEPKSSAKWPDKRKIVLEINLEEIELGYADVKKLAKQLKIVTNPSKIGSVLMGNKYGPSNFGRDLTDEDMNLILDELKKIKTPEAMGKRDLDIDAPEEYDPKLTSSPVRLQMIKGLFANLQGPKGGPSEEIENVSNAYVVGILKTQKKSDMGIGIDPSDTVTHGNIDYDSIAKDDDSIAKDDDEYKISPDYDLNPLLGAKSVGLSFVVRGENPQIKTCFTWGRYIRSDISKKLFRRQMNFFVTTFDLKKQPPDSFEPQNHPSKHKRISKAGAEIQVITTRVLEKPNTYHVSIFLLNNTQPSGNHSDATDWIYQPQIRVRCEEGTELEELDSDTEYADNEQDAAKDRLIYAHRKNMARGHFCGAMWHDIDPEDYENEGFSTFNWPDSKSKDFPKVFVKEFTRPSVRTEFFPTYSILQPEIDSQTEFNTRDLSEIVDPESKLQGIVENYEKWISGEEKKAEEIQDIAMRKAAKSNLDDCRRSKDRIRGGIQLLKSNEKARLAFCFMNKAIALKSEWEGTGDFSWREFQMAFILQCIRGIAQHDHPERDLCDVLWFPTGGGKTEAYLGLALFSITFSRLQKSDKYSADGGVSVISRYTLRLLTMQQFQRAVAALTAADYLRVSKWLPSTMTLGEDLRELNDSGSVWGNRRISIGLLIGGSATPNKFKDAEKALRGDNKDNFRGEPSQILNCPCCQSVLAVPTSGKTGLDERTNTLRWILQSSDDLQAPKIQKSNYAPKFRVLPDGVAIKQIGTATGSKKFYEIRISFENPTSKPINGKDIIDWWKRCVSFHLPNNTKPACTSVDRPGYFFVKDAGARYDFAIYCPNSDCQLNRRQIWFESTANGPVPPVPKPFKIKDDPSRSLFMPIPAFTIDEQIFRRCPSMLISTVDKFAMLPFMEDFASVFGNVDQYDNHKGYGRKEITKYSDSSNVDDVRSLEKPFPPPNLIIQDELHLIEGPLGSTIGAYEIAFDTLSSPDGFGPKYIASSATIKEAHSQVGSVYRRRASIFPPQGTSVEDNYFSKSTEDRESNGENPGRLHLGICAPMKILTLPVRIWASLLSEVYKIRKNPHHYGLDEENIDEKTDPYWTLVGYYNAIKELQISRSLYEDDIRRDVKNLSCQKIHSIDYQKEPLSFKPGLRLFPVRVDVEERIKITKVVVYCKNSRGRMAVAVFEDFIGKSLGNIIAKTKNPSKLCSKGPNEFELETPVCADSGDVLWISIANDSAGTQFETGHSQMPSLFVDMTSEGLDEILDKHDWPVNPALHDEKETIRISLTSEPRVLAQEPVELTGHTESQELPNVLKMLDKNDVDTVFTTAVFGTGIDIQRLGLMTVMGQPKTTSSYIQSTGRVGRNNPGLVVTWYKATNVRDLNHYENFVGYHRMLQRFVEPISASPFAEESLKSHLGPVLVSILRNSRNVPTDLVDNEKGPMKIREYVDDAGNSTKQLHLVCSDIVKRLKDDIIPPTRRPSDELAESRVRLAIEGWKKDARNLFSERKKLRYLEWTMDKPPENNVVLGTPQHDIEGKTTVFPNVRTSMRNVESTATFLGDDKYDDGRHIRPSQFITTYGPGSLLRVGHIQMIIPSLASIVEDLKKRKQFNEPDDNGKRELNKFEIHDKKIEKTIQGILEKEKVENYDPKDTIKIFELPSNADLSVHDKEKMYTMDVFPKWAICKHHNILRQMDKDGRQGSLSCSLCQKENKRDVKGMGVRFIQACPQGHMDDIDWRKEVHKGNPCDGKEYDWDEEENTFEVTCRKCNAKTTYGELRSKSENNRLECSGYWAEHNKKDSRLCSENTEEGAQGTAKLVLKNASNLRITHVVSSLIIPPYADRLYRMMSEYSLMLLLRFADEDITKNKVIQSFRKLQKYKSSNIDEEFISNLRDESEVKIKNVIRLIREQETGAISEEESEDSEFEQLAQASELGYPNPIDGRLPDFFVDKNKVRCFHSYKLDADLVVTPVDILHVIKAQVGYRRAVKTKHEDEASPYMITPTGNLVPTYYEEQNRTDSTKWFVGKRVKGEGIFIRSKNHDFIARTESFNEWKSISDEQSDEKLKRCTDPVFVWWHSFAHRLVADLSIDSGFQSASIAEKTYVRKNSQTGKTEAGILLYTVQEGDGTLGGLTGLVPNFGRIIENAILRLSHCSNDPLCKNRKFNENRVNGSACHACILISETSCGLQNRFLDRNLLLESA